MWVFQIIRPRVLRPCVDVDLRQPVARPVERHEVHIPYRESIRTFGRRGLATDQRHDCGPQVDTPRRLSQQLVQPLSIIIARYGCMGRTRS